MFAVHISINPRGEAARQLLVWLAQYEQRPTLLLLSGGSSLAILEDVVLPRRLHLSLGVIDERVGRDARASNFLALTQTEFFRRARELGGEMLIEAEVSLANPEEYAALYERALRAWREVHEDGIILAVLGLGADGHTAGIFPSPDDELGFKTRFVDTKRWVVGYALPENMSPYRERVTVTIPFLVDEVAHTLVYAVGAEKAEALKRSTVGNEPAHLCPLRAVLAVGDVHIFTDTNLGHDRIAA